jgi:hypothetical protein
MSPTRFISSGRFTCHTGPSGVLPFAVNLYLPLSGAGPFPILVGADLAWSGGLDNPTPGENILGPANIGSLVNGLNGNKYIIAEVSIDDFTSGLDPQDFPPTQPSGANGVTTKPIISSYPWDATGATGFSWGMFRAWAWGFSRLVDFLTQLSYVDATKIGLSGHSRRGSCVTFAAAFDTRIACVVDSMGETCIEPWRGSSIGTVPAGTLLNHYAHYASTSGGTVTGWMNQLFTNFNNNGAVVGQMPFDNHELAGLVAPRLWLSLTCPTDNNEDPLKVAQGFNAAQQIYTALGVPNNIGVWMTTDTSNSGPAGLGHDMNFDKWVGWQNFTDNKWFGVTGPFSNFTAPYNTITPYFTPPSASPYNSGLPAIFT